MVIGGALLKILHLEIAYPSTLIIIGLIMSIAGQEWKIKLLNKKIRKLEAENQLANKAELG